jgi:hypothetical protein
VRGCPPPPENFLIFGREIVHFGEFLYADLKNIDAFVVDLKRVLK